jgi:predicted nuclease with RNAse H fold
LIDKWLKIDADGEEEMEAEAYQEPQDPLDTPLRRRTPSRLRATFLRHLGRWGTFTQAAAAIGVDARTVHRWREQEPAFAKRCRDVLDRRRQMLEDECMRRARTPRVVRRFLHHGKQVRETHAYNDRLLIKMLDLLDANEARALKAAQKEAQSAAIAAAVTQAIAPFFRPGEADTKMSALPGQAESGPTANS